VSTDAQASALKAVIAGATKAPCYDNDEAQELGEALPDEYHVIYLSRRFGGNVRGDTRENDLRRLQTRVHATKVFNARLIEDRLAAAFAHATHDIDGALMHFDFETQDPGFELEDGYYHRLTDWTSSV
jgi:hypothetical protein